MTQRASVASLAFSLTVLSSCMALPAAPADDAILLCPREAALCAIDASGQWRRVTSLTDADAVQEIGRTASGRLVLLVRGHADAGAIVVLESNGERLLTSALAQGGGQSLSALVGEDSKGGILLCNGEPGTFLCDLWISSTSDADVRYVPPGCLFPRFDIRRQLVCLDTGPSPALVREIEAGRFERVALPFSGATIRGFELGDRDSAFLQTDGELHVWDGSNWTPQEANVRWLGRVGGHVVVTSCRESSDRAGFEDCKVRKVDQRTNALATVWASEEFVPWLVQVGSDGSMVVDSWNQLARQRKIVRVSLTHPLSVEILWTSGREGDATRE